MQRKIGDFFKRIKVTEDTTNITKSKNTQQIEIVIEGDTGLFKDEKEKIMQGAKQLLAIGKADNMVEAIRIIAVMFRGLKFTETRTTEDGKTVVVLKDTARERINIDENHEDPEL